MTVRHDIEHALTLLSAIHGWHSGDASELGGRTVGTAESAQAHLLSALDALDTANHFTGIAPRMGASRGPRYVLVPDPVEEA